MKVSFLRRGWGPAALTALLLTGCGKGKPADNARVEAADNPTETSSPAASETADAQTAPPPADEATPETGGNDSDGGGDGGDGSSSGPARPVAAEAATSTWVCTWCHEEYTGERQPTSFQPGKCERNPGHAHAWHKK